MLEISLEVLQQLEQAQAEITQRTEASGPPGAVEVTSIEAIQTTFGTAGSGQAKYILMDHYTTSSLRRMWAYSGGTWCYRNVTDTEEQGLAQVSFAANRVDAWWDGNNQITLLRCWKCF